MIDNLCHQIEIDNLSGVEDAVKAGVSINQYSAAGLTPLGTAIIHGHLAITQFLLNKGADISLAYKSDLCLDKTRMQSDLPEVCAAVHCASISGSADLIRLLVDHGADINDPSGIDYGAEMLPLFLSRGDATKALIELGADVSRSNSSGFTPLLHAMAREDISSTRLLVDNGADVEVERKTKYRVRVPLENGKEDTEERLVEGTSSPLMVACHQGRLRPTSFEMIKILASGGADVNRLYYIKTTECDLSFTVLSLICGSRTPTPLVKGAYAKKDQYGEKEVAAIRELIAAGADVNNPALITYLCEGEMPFEDFESRFGVIQKLVNHGLHLDAQSGRDPVLALLKSYTKHPEAQAQFFSIATVLAGAGMNLGLCRDEMELTGLPADFYNQIRSIKPTNTSTYNGLYGQL
ncbi:Serine/threonine-protein phosphatase 6 regulatory ankyrin repeat subunit C [Trichoderma lentiforme]|uniref:Serine/threonine-protein phosphatase 6 regulatory ankyrin repeat subunit C n=1 Tax=Trichoderma lentiforme TaxID=1567552 RepID=A0A9P5C7V9_9HYPO|nr:Serine/threonine-protein phosphatase 6 regulatory ankyrin repeat subunit C [Trichoderma lentiforme]